MLCCLLFTSLAAASLWLARRLLPARLTGSKPSALAWRPGQAPGVTEPGRVVFSLHARWRSFGYAMAGLRSVVKSEHNAWLHLIAACAVVVAGNLVGIERSEWLWLVAAIASVLAAETMNTAIERLCDVIEPGHNSDIGRVKDMAAGAVLVCAAGAATTGVIIFAPYLFDQFTDFLHHKH